MDRNIKIGVFGLGRGAAFINTASQVGCEVVAICDWVKSKHDAVRQSCSKDVVSYYEFDEFIKHDMDAVVLTNYFNEHAPFAIKALKAGKHVISECICNATLAEGVALCRAVEESGKIYMLAENYPYTRFNLGLSEIYKSGELGRVLYAEGEYNHPIDNKGLNILAPGINHWRNVMPSTYYCTHALAPLMLMTDTMPMTVNAQSIYTPDLFNGTARHSVDACAIMLIRMDNGSLFRTTGWGQLGGHSCWYRLHGTKGAAEVVRGPGYFGTEKLRVWHDDSNAPEGVEHNRVFDPQWPTNGDLAEKAGHGGGDFWVMYYFAEAIRSGKQPYIDVYKGVAMSSVGILGWKSVLNNGSAFEMPDFSKEESRKNYENDNFNPFIQDELGGIQKSSIKGYEPTKEDIEAAKKDWAEIGYLGD